MPEAKCPYQKECATIMYWSKEKADFIKEVCNTEKYTECLHFSASLQPQHEERERLYGNPHHGEPDWDVVSKGENPERIDWSKFDKFSEMTCTCRCGQVFRSHAKSFYKDKLGTITRKPCPQCGRNDNCYSFRSDPEIMTIG